MGKKNKPSKEEKGLRGIIKDMESLDNSAMNAVKGGTSKENDNVFSRIFGLLSGGIRH